MAVNTREQFLDAAETLFAERGFYGVSIAAIGTELGLTKQALLHHFGSKEKLYGEVLGRISDRFDAITTQTSAASDPTEAFVAYFIELYGASLEEPHQTRLLMRELLDNRRRADTAGTWYLKPFLEHLIRLLQAIPSWRTASEMEALAMIYQFLGALNYYAISAPTLTGIFGDDAYAELDQAFPSQLDQLMRSALSARG
ncbi:MAG: TetR/AcrR family transcriptional regulator [Pseudomonadota bacterium]